MKQKMAVSVLTASSVPKLCSNPKSFVIRSEILNPRNQKQASFKPYKEISRSRSQRNDSTRLNMGLSEIEPDLNEDPKDRWATNSVHPVSLRCIDDLVRHGNCRFFL